MGNRVLIADDNELARRVVRDMMRSLDLEVCAEAGNGEEAVKMVEVAQPDLIILDFMMPVMDGLEAARQMLKLRPSVPIVLNTFYLTEQLSAEAHKVGVRKVVSKSDYQSLVRAVKALLRKESLRPEDTIPGAS